MSSNESPLVPFEFEGLQVRVITDEKGQPWFVAADVCSVLGIGNPRQAMSRLDDDEKGVISTDTPGGEQVMTTVNEPGLYNLVIGSRKPEARRFKRWVTHEVLPTIRRTGRYAIPGALAALPAAQQDSVSALLLIGQAVAQVPGVKPGIAMAATLTCIQENTGLATETLRRALPAAEQPICSLNPTGLGQLLGMKAKDTNQHLAACGLQVRNQRGEWELTDAGRHWGEALPYCRQGHSGYQILWNPAVVDVVRELG
ncbi:Bro-N domain-containing protein [Synechococcus sp. 1G10]|uniref:BRO-N domain-containing protein n=1 Tax=Synechococcus sp. 1G10 TaxID=2025605 RepID=UPI000B982F2C|nr:Bro-N domain-containing protein [Synechococcus sp. 1G10]